MDFTFAPEHIELADALKRWSAAHHGLAQRRSAIATGTDAVWPALVELGVTALAVSEAHGGYGGSAVDLLPTMQALGSALAITPFWSTAVAAKALEWGGSAALCDQLLPQVAAGSTTLALAWNERRSRHDLLAVQTLARRSGDGYTLHGEKTVVLFGAQATHWLVSARLDDAAGELALFIVPASAPQVRVNGCCCIDNLPAADLLFDATPVLAGHRVDASASITRRGAALLQRVADFGAALLCGEALGLMEQARDATISHLQTRKQFGSPLASFQALQHRIVDVAMQLEQARSITYLAAANAGSADTPERVRCVAAAKALVGEAALFVGRQCVQLHGAIGLTDEMTVSHVLKRLTMIDQTLGDSDHHYARFAELETHESTRST
jgi:alkylation response protein AidB-like acyl-CoA dehydrogenase